MIIKITKKEEIDMVRMYAAKKSLPYVRAVIQAVKHAEERPFLMGKIATYEFMLRIRKEEQDKKKSDKK